MTIKPKAFATCSTMAFPSPLISKSWCSFEAATTAGGSGRRASSRSRSLIVPKSSACGSGGSEALETGVLAAAALADFCPPSIILPVSSTLTIGRRASTFAQYLRFFGLVAAAWAYNEYALSISPAFSAACPCENNWSAETPAQAAKDSVSRNQRQQTIKYLDEARVSGVQFRPKFPAEPEVSSHRMKLARKSPVAPPEHAGQGPVL